MKKFILVAVLCVGVMANAGIINIDCDNLTNPPGTFNGQGAYADPGNDFWNGYPGEAVSGSLLESDGITDSGVTISVTGKSGSHAWNLGHAMLGDYLFTSYTSADILISGLVADTEYQIYAYIGGDKTDQNTEITLNGVTVVQTDSAYLGLDYVEGAAGNYFVMSVTTDAVGDITGNFTNAGARYGALRGLQIIPEPATMLLLGLGSLVSLRPRK